jgi:hypothetical protein
MTLLASTCSMWKHMLLIFSFGGDRSEKSFSQAPQKQGGTRNALPSGTALEQLKRSGHSSEIMV